jgi:hypothetical protein
MERPTTLETRAVWAYTLDVDPVSPREQEYIAHKQDLVTLRRSQDPDLISRVLERCVSTLSGRIPLIQVRQVEMESLNRWNAD